MVQKISPGDGESPELPILYRDDRFIAIHKPAGLLVHRSIVDASETVFAVQMLRNQIDHCVFPVHRLDKPTSGLLLFALDREAAAGVAEQFSRHTVSKTYLAIVRGYAPDQAQIDHPVKAQRDKHAKANGQPGITDLRTLARVELDIPNDKYPRSRYSLVALSPQTGRRHQLRYHMKHLAHPIIGDPRYGKNVHNTLFKQHFASHRLLLAAIGLGFIHPFSRQPVEIRCPPSDDFMAVARQLGWEDPIHRACRIDGQGI